MLHKDVSKLQSLKVPLKALSQEMAPLQAIAKKIDP
jgi:hypothetical protein